MAVSDLEAEMAAEYVVLITGIQRSRAQIAELDGVIATLSTGGQYNGGGTVTQPGDVFTTEFEDLVGNIQGAVTRAMSDAMKLGRDLQVNALRNAITDKGLSGKPTGRKSAGRDYTGDMIQALDSGTGSIKNIDETQVTGWHGWKNGRQRYFEYQENGTLGRGEGANGGLTRKANFTGAHYPGKKRLRRGDGSVASGVPAANSLGTSIPAVTQYLIRELNKAL